MADPLSPCYLSDELRALEASAHDAEPPLMERAGRAAAEWLRLHAAPSARLLVIAGPGNNGGDALVVARLLREWGYRPDVVLLGEPARLPADAALAWQAFQAAGCTATDKLPSQQNWDWIVDGLFGVGLNRPPAAQFETAIAYINRCTGRVLSLDIPSGLNADTGQPPGLCVAASHTLSFLGWKPGLFTGAGRDFCGQLSLSSLGVAGGNATGALVDHPPTLPAPRRHDSHKGRYGTVGVVGGATGMVGAAWLAGRAAQAVGAGKVQVGTLAPSEFDPSALQLMCGDPGQLVSQPLAALALGPGLGDNDAAHSLLSLALAGTAPLVLDADALNLLAADAALVTQLVARNTPAVLTPHPLEAARLLGQSTADVQADRVVAARRLARSVNHPVVLKGSGSVIALPDGRWWVNASGGPALASAGMGDVLTGMIAGLAAQGLVLFDALLTGVWLHGQAGEDAAAATGGPLGVSAEEVILAARHRLNALVYGPKRSRYGWDQ